MDRHHYTRDFNIMVTLYPKIKNGCRVLRGAVFSSDTNMDICVCLVDLHYSKLHVLSLVILITIINFELTRSVISY